MYRPRSPSKGIGNLEIVAFVRYLGDESEISPLWKRRKRSTRSIKVCITRPRNQKGLLSRRTHRRFSIFNRAPEVLLMKKEIVKWKIRQADCKDITFPFPPFFSIKSSVVPVGIDIFRISEWKKKTKASYLAITPAYSTLTLHVFAEIYDRFSWCFSAVILFNLYNPAKVAIATQQQFYETKLQLLILLLLSLLLSTSSIWIRKNLKNQKRMNTQIYLCHTNF